MLSLLKFGVTGLLSQRSFAQVVLVHHDCFEGTTLLMLLCQ